jgi:hypothetical protein
MTFDTINYIFYDKKKDNLNTDIIMDFNPFITQKSFSFYDGGKYANYINDTTNVYMTLFSDKEDTFNLFREIIPMLKRKKIEYIKKGVSKNKEKDSDTPIPEFLSKREIDLYSNILK